LELITSQKTQRNDPCPCGSSRKFKKCCGGVAAAESSVTSGPETLAADPAMASLMTMVNPANTVLTLSAAILSGELAAKRGEIESALSHLERAVRIEDGLAYMEPPDWDHSVRLNLAAVLLEAQRPAEAEVVYWEDLRRHPENGWALHGLAQAFRAEGKIEEATQTEERFHKAWAQADSKLE
jgi:tetratricopeptide (TPR) repeat protein